MNKRKILAIQELLKEKVDQVEDRDLKIEMLTLLLKLHREIHNEK